MAVAYFAAQKAYVAEKVGREMNVMEKLGYHQIITVAVQDPVKSTSLWNLSNLSIMKKNIITKISIVITSFIFLQVYNYLASQRTHYQYQHQYLVCILHDINIFESIHIVFL